MLISVVVPAYLAARCLPKAIESVMQQTVLPNEVIIVENMSPDDTLKVALGLAKRYGKLLRVYRESKPGAAAARQLGLLQARGHWIAFLDSDDLWLPRKIEAQLAYIHDHPDVSMVHTQGYRINPDGRRVLSPEYVPSSDRWCEYFLARKCSVSTSTVIVRRSTTLSVGGFDPRFRLGEDFELWLRISASSKVACLAEPLAIWPRGHFESTLRRRGMVVGYRFDLAAWQKNKHLFSKYPQLAKAWQHGYAVLYQLLAHELAVRGRWTEAGINYQISCLLKPSLFFSPTIRSILELLVGSRAWNVARKLFGPIGEDEK